MKFWMQVFIVGAVALGIAGCGSSKPTPIPVSGTVTLAEGAVPEGEIRVIRFEPVTPGPDAKPASGDIEKDGSFKLTTIEHHDGAYPGEYNVVFSVWKTYIGREELLAPQFTKAETTPLKASVKSGSQRFEFKVEAKP